MSQREIAGVLGVGNATYPRSRSLEPSDGDKVLTIEAAI
jgi:hypothetical protein